MRVKASIEMLVCAANTGRNENEIQMNTNVSYTKFLLCKYYLKLLVYKLKHVYGNFMYMASHYCS